jgi:hypothetical protein
MSARFPLTNYTRRATGWNMPLHWTWLTTKRILYSHGTEFLPILQINLDLFRGLARA